MWQRQEEKKQNRENMKSEIFICFEIIHTLTIFFIDKTITLLFEAILSGWFFVGSCGFDMIRLNSMSLQCRNICETKRVR